MSEPEPGALLAADHLATHARMQAAVRAASLRYVGWLIAFASLNVVYLTGLGVLTDDRSVLWLTAAYLVATAGVTVGFLAGVQLTPSGFSRRWVRALVSWGAVFAGVLVLGLLVFRGEPLFWFPASLVAAVPLVVGARAEARA